MKMYGKRGVCAFAAGALALGLAVSGGGVAQADAAPSSTDVVGVGSDTLQDMLDFGADGSAQGLTGYNQLGNINRLISFDATADANARAAYLPNSTSSLSPTVVLRAGTKPVQRPNGSGAGIKALNLDHSHNIDFIRMSRPPTAAEQSTAAASSGVGSLEVVQLAKEDLTMAVANTTDAPALTTTQLKAIYTCSITKWSDIDPSLSGNTIVPVIPQVGSGTRSV
ncbi:MAG: substrate-binding domain-containing protein, partial [Actinobacteria bacterium]|nr:substrate-binding domain-containing protein [Actinomycetota bacterium]